MTLSSQFRYWLTATTQFGMVGLLTPLFQIKLDSSGSGTPLYRQLAELIRHMIESGELNPGDRLPATRELAGQLGLNRTTVSAAYAALEEWGLIEGQVGRGSFIAPRQNGRPETWDFLSGGKNTERTQPSVAAPVEISFASSRPPEEDFPLASFRKMAAEVLEDPGIADILQLGSPLGYGPLRRYLLAEAQQAGIARASDDVLITNGCQQALDLLARLLGSFRENAVAIENPVYHGLLRVLGRSGCNMVPVPVDADGIELPSLERVLAEKRPRLLVVTPNFQNPTGATLSLGRRKAIIDLAQRFGTVLVENDIYGELRYEGTPLPTLKELDPSGNVILLRSYSKIAFPGLRVGWVIAPQPVVLRLGEAKQWADLHSDHLSQAILLRFAKSGELAQHIEKTCRDGKQRLASLFEACERYWPSGTQWTRPAGGMSLWVTLPEPLQAEHLLLRARERGVDFLPGAYFSAQPGAHDRSLRLGFGGLSPAVIRHGIQILGEAAQQQLGRYSASSRLEPAMALV